MIDIKEICECYEVDSDGALLFNENWIISKEGDLIGGYSGNYFYGIWDYMLSQPDWIAQLMNKRWFDINTFIPVYIEALCRAGVEEVRCRYCYGEELHTIHPFELREDSNAVIKLIRDIISENKNLI